MKGNTEDDGNSKERRRFNPAVTIASTMQSFKAWAAQDKNGLKDFVLAQLKVTVILVIAHMGNKFEPAYPRNDNHDPTAFWIVNAILAIGTFFTWKWEASKTGRSGGNPRIVCLGREQTEEWKGWMQWAFIFYHYYRVYYVYNEIRVFVSAYVWMVSSYFHCFVYVICLFQIKWMYLERSCLTTLFCYISIDWLWKLSIL